MLQVIGFQYTYQTPDSYRDEGVRYEFIIHGQPGMATDFITANLQSL